MTSGVQCLKAKKLKSKKEMDEDEAKYVAASAEMDAALAAGTLQKAQQDAVADLCIAVHDPWYILDNEARKSEANSVDE
jgi:hypothetical protein